LTFSLLCGIIKEKRKGRCILPNWCTNTIEIVGDKGQIESLLKLMKTDRSNFDFGAVIPYPEDWAKLDAIAEEWWKLPKDTRGERPADGFNQGGYTWCVSNWGTKWWVEDAGFRDMSEGVNVYFDTAWSPCTPVTLELSKRFPELEFTHYFQEECGDFSGYEKYKNGKSTGSLEGGAYDVEFPGSAVREEDEEDEE
jgi:hypothetical protein